MTRTCSCSIGWAWCPWNRWPALDEIPRHRQPREQSRDRQHDRSHNVDRRQRQLTALIEQCSVQRKGGECGVAAENAGGEEQPPVLRRIAPEGEIAGDEAHD